MIVRHNGPRDADLVQNRDYAFAKARFRWEVTARKRRGRAPKNFHLPFVDAQFHFKGFIRDEGRESVVIGEIDQVKPRFAATGAPRASLLIAGIPICAVAELIRSSETLQVF